MGFRQDLAALQPPPGPRRWFYVPYDQLSDALGPMATVPPEERGIVLVESPWKARRRPYHRQKLALLLSSQRHFALEQARAGVAVDLRVSRGPFREALEELPPERYPLEVMEPAERELRLDLAPLLADGRLRASPHEGWLSTPEDFRASQKGDPPWRMDAFYRHMRRRTGWLMEDGRPVGGRFSFDGENRKAWRGEPQAPIPPRFAPDALTEEVCDLVRHHFPEHPGELDPGAIPATLEDVEVLWEWALAACLPHFGPYEDAMSRSCRSLFHTRISPLVNLHRLLPERVVREALETSAPLASREGFLRQVLGWREFVRHVHRESDGFRNLPGNPTEVREVPGDGGWARWSGRPWERSSDPSWLDGGATPAHLGVQMGLPPAYWGQESGLSCLDEVVAQVWEEGWTHHIPRLMVLSNLANLLGVDPRELTDWFWVGYVDAYDWVVEPNVLGMGTFATGEVMTTKPYVSGAAYLNRMSDFCKGCAFDPRKNCPVTRLYWAFLARHAAVLEGNRRMAMPLRSLAKRSQEQREEDRRAFERVREALAAGRSLVP